MGTDANKYHPISTVFPLLPEDELMALADDIRQHGLREPILRFEDMILDGRNRLLACKLANKEPKYREFKGTYLEAVAYSWSINRQRRHLNSSQVAIAESKRAKMVDEYAAQIEKQKAAAATRKGGDRKSDTAREKKISAGNNSRTDKGRVRDERATSAGTNPRYVSDADMIVNKRPDLAKKIEAGAMTIPQAKREMNPPAPPKPVSVSQTFGDHLSEIRQMLSGIRDQYGDGEKMLASELWRDCDTEYAIEMTRMLAELLTTLHEEMSRYARKTQKAKSA